MAQLGETSSIRVKIASGEIDYSFCELPTLEDIFDEKPRVGLTQQQIVEIHEKNSNGPENVNSDTTVVSPSKKVRTPAKVTAILKLNNNALPNLNNLVEIIPRIVLIPEDIRILDLSMNAISKIDPALVTMFPRLSVLKLHGNNLTKLSSIVQLSALNLMSLTLHGNDVEHIPGYRSQIINAIPSLKTLDFTTISVKERKDAETWKRLNPPKKTRAD
eukprot:m.145039 g.145039  ORF g.145039 m.145039 type:complete len:217 (+) comp30411_c0_seq1:180-830(+)